MLGKDEKQTFVSIDFMTQKSSKHPSTSLDQNEHAFNFVGDVNIGFVSLLGDSRFLYATLYHVTTSILTILASFGHFFTSGSPPVRRRGLQTCGSCRVGRLSPLALHPNCQEDG